MAPVPQDEDCLYLNIWTPEVSSHVILVSNRYSAVSGLQSLPNNCYPEVPRDFIQPHHANTETVYMIRPTFFVASSSIGRALPLKIIT
jgi:hypothetical protein